MPLTQMPYFTSADGKTDKAVGIVPLQPNGAQEPPFPSWEWATRLGYAFVGSTAVQTVNSSNYMGIIFKNPVNSGRNCFIALREFADNVTTAPLEYQAYVNPTVTLTQSAAAANMQLGNATTAVGQVTWQIATTLTTLGGTPATGGFLPVTGTPRELDYLGMITPGTSLGYLIQGAGGGALQNQARITLSMFWYEEVI